MNEAPPKLPDNAGFSEEFKDFIVQWFDASTNVNDYGDDDDEVVMVGWQLGSSSDGEWGFE